MSKSKRILDVYDANDEEDQSVKLMKRRGGGGSSRNFDEVETLDFVTEDIDKEDDEEITEDEAFNDEDEETFGIFFNSKANVTKGDIKEASEEESDGEYIDLSEMFDEPKEAKNENVPLKTSAVSFLIPEQPISSDDNRSEEEFSSSSDDDSDSATDFVDIISSSITSRLKRKRLTEKTEAVDESEFKISGGIDVKKKISLSDLIEPIDDEMSFGGLKRQLGSLGREQALSAPLAPIIQEKVDRKAAKVETEKSISRWMPIVRKNRLADTLSFPMNEPSVINLSSGALVGKFEPFTDMEKEIDQVLEQSGLTEKRQKELEELELNTLSKEEVEERRAALSKMKSALFFAEQKQKRVGKIKSKTFRKIAKKAAQKHELSMEELQTLDPEKAKLEQDQLDFERAKERMTLKHKNTGKWAKRMLSRKQEAGSEVCSFQLIFFQTHKALMEQLEKGDSLRQRISGVQGSESDTDNDVSAVEQLNQLKADEKESLPSKGVFAMKFMKNEMKRQKLEVEKMIEDAKAEVQGLSSTVREAEGQNVNSGRLIIPKSGGNFSGANLRSKDFEASSRKFDVKSGIFKMESFETENIPLEKILEIGKFAQEKIVDLSVAETPVVDKPILEAPSKSKANVDKGTPGNPWVLEKEEFKNLSKRTTTTLHQKSGKSDKTDEKSISKIKAKKERLLGNLENSDNESELITQTVFLNTNEDIEESCTAANADIMRLAFADDNIQEEFDLEKAEAVAEEAAPELEMPGWGGWSGPGIKVNASKKKTKSETGNNKEALLAKRKDANLKHVVINEKRSKKAAKYMQPKVPYGFENREQYERTLLNPLGKEWNTYQTHKQLTQPRIVTKLGVPIAPLRMQGSKKRS